MRTISILFALLTSVDTVDPGTAVAAAAAAARAKRDPVPVTDTREPKLYNYTDGLKAAKELNRPLVVWLGFPFPHTVGGAINAVPDDLDVVPAWWPKTGVVISLFEDGKHRGYPVPLEHQTDLTSADVRATVRKIREAP